MKVLGRGLLGVATVLGGGGCGAGPAQAPWWAESGLDWQGDAQGRLEEQVWGVAEDQPWDGGDVGQACACGWELTR